MALIAIQRRRHYSGHSTAPPHRPSPSPSHYKRAPPPRSIPHLSRPSLALLPSSPLASISATATRSMPLRAHLRPSSASPMSPPASPSSPTPPWLLTASFSTLKHRPVNLWWLRRRATFGRHCLIPICSRPSKPQRVTRIRSPEGVCSPVHHGPWTGALSSVHRPVDLVHGISFRKITP
jgi:hypothetical protein